MKLVVASVNYGTSHLIEQWATSIKKHKPDAELIIVDNLYDNDERQKATKICRDLCITLIESENLGYGAGLNIAIKYYKSNMTPSPSDVILLGNLDILFERINIPNINEPRAFIAYGLENNKKLNPFLTLAQKKILFIHSIPANFNSSLLLYCTTAIVKIFSLLKSPPWTTHGSLFCINSAALDESEIFNQNSFLYSEELEFGSHLEKTSIKLENIDIRYQHIPHAATSRIISGHKRFFKYWKPSFLNWYEKNFKKNENL